MGYACAVGVVLLVIALAINIVQLIANGTLRMRRNNMADEKNRKGDKRGPKSGKTKRTVGTVLGTGFFAVLSMIIIFPVFAGLFASFRPGTEITAVDCRSISISVQMNLITISTCFPEMRTVRNILCGIRTLVITIVSVVLTLFICYFVAYGLTMYNFKLKNFLFFLVIATMMVPFEILMLPLYKEIIALHLIDTYTGVIIIGLCNASTIFFFRQYLSDFRENFWMRRVLTVRQSTVLRQKSFFR